MSSGKRRRLLAAVALVGALGAIVFALFGSPVGAVGSSHSPAHQIYTDPQPGSNADYSGHGANTHGPYDSTRDGSASQNGKGDGAAVGKPCAGCVGKADNKNPPGQMPDGSDHNAGYECDRNQGVGQGNPAHTSCKSTSSTPTSPSISDSSSPDETPSTGDSSSPDETPSTGDSSSPDETPSTGDSSSPDETPSTGDTTSSSGSAPGESPSTSPLSSGSAPAQGPSDVSPANSPAAPLADAQSQSAVQSAPASSLSNTGTRTALLLSIAAVCLASGLGLLGFSTLRRRPSR